MNLSFRDELENLRDLRDGITELVDEFDAPFIDATEVVLGYLTIRGKKAQITLRANVDEQEWIGD